MQVKATAPMPPGTSLGEAIHQPAAGKPMSVLLAVFKPLRLNFAQVCLYCGTRWCASPRCVELHAESIWIPCEDCDGFSIIVDCTMCAHGVVQIDRDELPAQDGRVLSNLPPDAPAYKVSAAAPRLVQQRRVPDAPVQPVLALVPDAKREAEAA